jgi:hypothetical protein
VAEAVAFGTTQAGSIPAPAAKLCGSRTVAVHWVASPKTRIRLPPTAPRLKGADMKHEMILLDADLRTVLARLARKFQAQSVDVKEHASVAQAAEHSPRKREDAFSSDAAGSTLDVT